jgi:hypothetical protein
VRNSNSELLHTNSVTTLLKLPGKTLWLTLQVSALSLQLAEAINTP